MEVELHNVWITKMTLVSGQGKPGHMQSHKLFSGGKAHEKHHEREREYCQFFNLDNAQTDHSYKTIVFQGYSFDKECISLAGT